METVARSPFQGVLNIIKFNWHFYLIALAIVIVLPWLASYLASPLTTILNAIAFFTALNLVVSLAVSFYIYDYSGLYLLKWTDEYAISNAKRIVNIHAGFDETSTLIANKYPNATLIVFDFYNPEKHTEVSIKRARKAYPPYPGTTHVATNKIPMPPNSVDVIFIIFAAHEIRNKMERIQFFKSLKKSLRKDGQIIVVEHIRDAANFMAFNIGFLHFHSKAEWQGTFDSSGLTINSENKLTPFVSVYTLV